MSLPWFRVVAVGLGLGLLLAACGDHTSSSTAYFDTAIDLTGSGADGEPAYYNFPWPSDLRLDANGAPDLTGFPDQRHVPLLTSLMSVVGDRVGWPVMATAYFRFTAPIPEQDLPNVIVPGPDAPALLIDIDPSSPEMGATYPIVANTLPQDDYTSSNIVAIAPRPGIILRAGTIYAYVVRTAFAPGFTAPDAFAQLAAGHTPSGTRGAAAATSFAPLWPALAAAGIPVDDVVIATVFTTGDEVGRTRARSEAIRGLYHPTIDGLTLVGGTTLDGFCELTGTVTMPQFQVGTPPFSTDGRFVLDGNGVPMHQADMTIPLTITLPKAAMPVGGWPLYQFFHGSGGLSTDIVNLGYSPTSADNPTPGQGPGWVIAKHGIAGASAALPLNPERFLNATDYEYLNTNNLAAFPYTFQQGVFEQRLLLDALLALQIPEATVAGCTGISSASGVQQFDPAKLVAGGQSMGGMYTNMIAAVEGRYGALVPTGAGGFWNLMILETAIVPGARQLLSSALGVDDDLLSFVHPAMNLIGLGWEIAEPLASMARIGHRPLPGLPVRDVYEPVGFDDTYFPFDVYDAAALAYGNDEGGTAIWPSMQDALSLDGLGGLLPYPIKGNRVDANQDHHTRVVVQFMGDGIIDPHYIYRQLDTVKHQYGCFLETYLTDGIPTVSPPGALTDPCMHAP